jgi:hypothetical protein
VAILKSRSKAPVTIIPPEQQSMQASGVRVTRREADQYRRLIQPWQQQALFYYQTVGEAWYAAQFYARALSKLRVFAATRDENGEVTELDANDPASELLSRVQDRNGGTGQLFGSYGRLMFLSGEGYLTVTQDLEFESEEWEFLSADELRVVPGGGYVRYRAPSINPELLYDIPDNEYEPIDIDNKRKAVVYRLWRRHPQYSAWADSPMHGVLNLFEELSLLQLAVGARAKSRAAGAGILYVPTEISFGSADSQRNDDPNSDPFSRILQQVMTTAIKTPGSASAVAPIVVRGPAQIGGIPAKDAMFMLQIHDPNQTYPETGLRDECIKRIATGLDMPPELLLGMTDANHWTAWQIDDATWTAHLQPMADQLVSDLNATYLRPACKEAGIANWRDIVVGYDEAEIVNHPDRAKDARELYDAGVISAEKLREVNGFSDEDAQPEAEHEEWLAIKLRDKTFILEDPTQVALGNQEEASPPAAKDTVVEGPPNEALQDEDSAVVASAKVERILAAADLTVERVRELAGSRIRGKAAKCEECQPIIEPLDNGLVASALGQPKVEELMNGLALTAGGSLMFRNALTRWDVRADVALRLTQLVDAHASKQLYAEIPAPLPRGFAEYVARVV